jgi:hypothetical protein
VHIQLLQTIKNEKLQMKKNILIILILVVNISVNAQSSKIKFGIKTGINSSKYTPEMYLGNSRLADYQGKIGFYVGGFTNFIISKKLKIQPELLYVNQGTKMIFEDITLTDSNGNPIGNEEDVEYKINESVISLPIFLQYYINNKFNIDGGIQLGFIVNRKEEITKNPFEQFLGNNSQNNTNYDKFDFGFNIGLGYKVLEKMRVNTKYFIGIIERENSIKPSIFSLGIEYEI